MKIAVLGTGDVGKAIGNGFLGLGHEVCMGAREATNEKAAAWVASAGAGACHGTFAEAARFGEIVVLATLGAANEAVLQAAGQENLAGKVLIDTTNPLDFSQGFPPGLAVSGKDSGGEQVQRAAPDARVVKCWNTVGNALMFNPDLPGGPPTMFICGDDAAAKAQVSALLAEVGWEAADVGGIAASRYLEALCIVWVATAAKTGQWNQAFKLLKK